MTASDATPILFKPNNAESVALSQMPNTIRDACGFVTRLSFAAARCFKFSV
ncbi:hypothetical protein [Allochromatium warmingii]|uniref:hypothetical protein n=1 Tax=Allochromatium warmingii TaxID=61595 RepID=UPI0015A62F60|nr:hypothetical protein [Allochromatium warmingii]